MKNRYSKTTVKSKKHLVRSLDTFSKQYDYIYIPVEHDYIDYIDKNDEEISESKYEKFEILNGMNSFNKYFVEIDRSLDFSTNLKNRSFILINGHKDFDNIRGHKNKMNIPKLLQYRKEYGDGYEEGTDLEFVKEEYNLEDSITLHFSNEKPTEYDNNIIYSKEIAEADLKDTELALSEVDNILNIRNNEKIKSSLKKVISELKKTLFFADEDKTIKQFASYADIKELYAKKIFKQLKNRIQYADTSLYLNEFPERKKEKKDIIELKVNFINLYIKDMYLFVKNRYYLTKILRKEATNRIDPYTNKDYLIHANNADFGVYFNLNKYIDIFQKVYTHQVFSKFLYLIINEYKTTKDYSKVIHLEEFESIFSTYHFKIQKEYFNILVELILQDKETLEYIYKIREIDFFELSIEEFMISYIELFSPNKNLHRTMEGMRNILSQNFIFIH